MAVVVFGDHVPAVAVVAWLWCRIRLCVVVMSWRPGCGRAVSVAVVSWRLVSAVVSLCLRCLCGGVFLRRCVVVATRRRMLVFAMVLVVSVLSWFAI